MRGSKRTDPGTFAALWFVLLICLSLCTGITYALIQTVPDRGVECSA